MGDLYTIRLDLLSFLLSKEESNKLELYLLIYCYYYSFVTDLSENRITETELITTYDFVLFYIDMENEHSWVVCKSLLTTLSSMICMQRCCIIVNTRMKNNCVQYRFFSIKVFFFDKFRF